MSAYTDGVSGGVYFVLEDGGRIYLSSTEHIVVERSEYQRLRDYYEWRTRKPSEPPSPLFQRLAAIVALKRKL